MACVLVMGSLSVAAGEYVEVPSLAERVAAGELPPIEERVPDDPFIVGSGVLMPEDQLDWEPGTHGGTWRTAHFRPGWDPDVFLATVQPILIGPGFVTEALQGNVVKDFTVSDDNQEFIFHLREGLKWSDGHPVTTEDVRFAYEDVLMNRDLTGSVHAKYRSRGQVDGTPMTLEIIDEYTFRIAFDEPYGSFLAEIGLTGWAGYDELFKPSHYLKQFHADYTDLDSLQPYLDEEELEDWTQLYSLKDVARFDWTRPQSIGFPVLNPWMRVEGPPGVIIFERNPFYFKVDTEGRQLPYIDRVESFEVSDIEALNMKILAGEVDYHREGTALSRMPVYQEYADQAGFRVQMYESAAASLVFFLNLTYDDPAWQELTRDLRFREAINLALDREELVDSLFYGMAPELSLVPSEFNPEQANAILDELGLDQRDSDGYRLRPDGETLEIVLEVSAIQPIMVPGAEIMVENLQDIGIDASMRQISNELRNIRAESNELMATLLWLQSPMWRYDGFRDYLPSQWWAPRWKDWFDSAGVSGEEPPEDFYEVYRIHEEIIATPPTTDEGVAIRQALYDWFYETIPSFPIVERVAHASIVSQRMRNVPHSGFNNEINYRAVEQFFFGE